MGRDDDDGPFGGGIALPLDAIVGAIGSRLAGHRLDARSLDRAKKVNSHLRRCIHRIAGFQSDLSSMRSGLASIFTDTTALESMFEGNDPGPFLTVYKPVSKELEWGMDELENFVSHYNDSIGSVLDGAKADALHQMESQQYRQLSDAVSSINVLVRTVSTFMIKANVDLRDLATNLVEFLRGYDKYLRDRFLKKEELPVQGAKQTLIMVQRPDEEATEYVKIKFIEGSAVLTDMLLKYSASLPGFAYRPDSGKSRKKRKEDREISSFALDEASDRMIALSDPQLIRYAREPSKFFKRIGALMADYYTILKDVNFLVLKMLKESSIKFSIQGVGPGDTIEGSAKYIDRLLKKIEGVDFGSILQREDDVLPDNRIEKDHFKLREDMLRAILLGLEELNKLDFEEYAREEYASAVVREAVSLKADIDELLITPERRRIRKDKELDNEFYVASQAQFGQITFVRQPAPTIKVENVIGASFDESKERLNDVIDAVLYSRVMKLTSPDGKVRNNVMLIGPPGCGKTELGRAVCGDPRIIGAFISMGNGILTAWLHESANNVQRAYEALNGLYKKGRERKPVSAIFDEFEGFFVQGNGHHTDTGQVESAFLQVLDGVVDYSHIATVAMTNKPGVIPPRIMRRFAYVCVVGELTAEERAFMLQKYMDKGMPVSDEITSEMYMTWAERLKDAPGDIVRKAVDEVHRVYMREFKDKYPKKAASYESVLARREERYGVLRPRDVAYLKERLTQFRTVSYEEVDHALTSLLRRPDIQRDIEAARETYRDAKRIMAELENERTFGLRPRNNLWGH